MGRDRIRDSVCRLDSEDAFRVFWAGSIVLGLG